MACSCALLCSAHLLHAHVCLPCVAAEGEEETAQLHIRKVAHTGGINRVRACPQQPHIVASFADTAQVQVRRQCPGFLAVHNATRLACSTALNAMVGGSPASPACLPPMLFVTY